MKQDIAQRWIAALRDPNNHQGTQGLCKFDNNGVNYFCCLGLLTDIYLKEKDLTWEILRGPDKRDPLGMKAITTSDEQSYAILHSVVMHWAGIKHPLGARAEYLPTLTRVNDDGATFLQIADIIEKEWETL